MTCPSDRAIAQAEPLPCPRCKEDGNRSVTARHLEYDVLLIRCDQCRWATAVTEWDRHTSESITEIWNAAVTRATAAPVVVGEDAKRLDWLVANQGLLTVCSGRWFSAAGANVYEADTARGAIDAAIANQA